MNFSWLKSKRKYICYFITLLIASSVITFSFGYGFADLIDIMFISLVLMILSFYQRWRNIILIPLLIISALYFPAALLYGPPNVLIVSSLLQTNFQESVEFLKIIPGLYYVPSQLILILYFLIRIFVWPIKIERTTQKKIIYLFLFLVALPSISGKILIIKAIQFPVKMVESYFSYFDELKQLTVKNSNTKWDITHLSNEKDLNVVLIIGESMRADYMSVFGYPLPTTPFLDSVNGTFYRNYIATAPGTFVSLTRTLSISNGMDINVPYNIVSMAKQAGFYAFWLSNQGVIGEFDFPTAVLSTYCDQHVFLKKGHYLSSNNDDYALLPYLQEALASTNNSHKFIVLHIMGSHPNFADRLNGKKPYFSYENKNISDYISTYRKTDDLIKNVYDALKKANKPFRLIYFSDHGLSEQKTNNIVQLTHGRFKKQNYHVPLVILSSDDKNRKFIDTPKSAFNFLSLFADEIGIKVTTPVLHDWNDDTGPVKVFNGTGMIPYNELEDEPAIILK